MKIYEFSRRWGSSALLVGALLACTSSARADDAELRTAARDLATQGAQAFEAGRYTEATDFFRRAHELVPAPSIALLLARSLAKTGQLSAAIDVYEQTARFKLTDDAPPAYSQAVDSARSEVEEVRRRLPRLKLTLINVSSGDSPQVTIDDKPTPAVLLGVERPIDPGAHHIAVHVAGQLRAERDVSLIEAESADVELDILPLTPHADKRAVLAAPPVVTDGSSSASHSSLKPLGYVGLGIGVVGIGIGTVTGLSAMHHKSDLDGVCHPGCPASSADEIDSFRSNRTISWISFGVGIAAAATGVVLLTVGTPEREHVALRAFPGGLQIGGRL